MTQTTRDKLQSVLSSVSYDVVLREIAAALQADAAYAEAHEQPAIASVLGHVQAAADGYAAILSAE